MRAIVTALVIAVTTASAALGQVGKSQGVVDMNTVAEKDLAGMPNITPAIAQAIVAKRPFGSITELNALLVSQGLTPQQAMELYPRAFVHINLNTATPEEILLVPGAGRRMTHEFAEYRPWRSWAQFDREIGKYVGAEATAKLAQYCFIPMNANTASAADLLTIPGADQALVQKIKAGRPYKSSADLEQALANGSSASEAKRVARFLTVE
jgi:DNA uptake protein ComE-like DNA-binding protein